MTTIDVVCNGVAPEVWDAYVTRHPDARFCHLSGYRFIADTFGFIPRYFALLRRGHLVGVLPAFETRSLLFGRRLTSQPFTEYGGALLDPDLDAADIGRLVEQIRAVLHRESLGTLELHGAFGLADHAAACGLVRANDQHVAALALDRPIDALRTEVFNRSVRRGVDKARKAGVTPHNACDADLLRRWFYPLYLQSMKRLGVPPQPLRFFLDAHAHYGPAMRIQWALKDDRPIAALLGFRCGPRLSITTIASDKAAWSLAPNDLVHYDLIAWAQEAGCTTFDFGSVRYEGQEMFKRKWRCTLDAHAYYFLSVDDPLHRVATFSSSSSTMGLMATFWRRYMPDALARQIGPIVRHHLVR